jgi:hypothetical protein
MVEGLGLNVFIWLREREREREREGGRERERERESERLVSHRKLLFTKETIFYLRNYNLHRRTLFTWEISI